MQWVFLYYYTIYKAYFKEKISSIMDKIKYNILCRGLKETLIDIIIIIYVIFTIVWRIAMNNILDFRKIGIRIQNFRLENKMTQEELAERIGSTQKYVSRIEGGYNRLSLDTAVAIARALQISVDSLVADYDDSNDESTLQEILNSIRGMNPKQLELLRDNIRTLRKLDN